MDIQQLLVSPKKMRSILDSQMNKIFKDQDFSAAQVPFIHEIGIKEGLSLKELCMILGADKGLTTRVVRTLIEKGFVENRSDSSRQYELYLTDKGKAAFELANRTLNDILTNILGCLDPDEIESLKGITRKLNARLDELYEY